MKIHPIVHNNIIHIYTVNKTPITPKVITHVIKVLKAKKS